MEKTAHKLISPDAIKYTLEDLKYTEFDKSGKVVLTRKLRHPKSVRFEETGKLTLEFDEYDRTTFSSYDGNWCLKYYDEPTPTNKKSMPYHVVHKHWGLYNNL